MSGPEIDTLEGDGYAETSQYAAHLDRGWSMLDRGDHSAARRSAQHAQKLRPEAPDPAVLLAAVSLAEGEAEESVRWYERAQELDPEYLEPFAAAAHVMLFDLQDPERALSYCDQALSLASADPLERIDLELLAAECKLLSERVGEARTQLSAIDGLDTIEAALLADGDAADGALSRLLGAQDDALDDEELQDVVHKAMQLALRLARLWLDLREPDGALAWLSRLTTRYPNDADAWYLLSEAETVAGNGHAAACAALQSLQLDLSWELPEWVPEPTALHKEILEFLRHSDHAEIKRTVHTARTFVVVVHDTPAVELVLEGLDPRVPALVLVSRATPDGAPEPTGLAVYRRNIARMCDGQPRFARELGECIETEFSTFAEGVAQHESELAAARASLADPGAKKTRKTRTRKRPATDA
ncbi:MAG: hypothetical protein B7733_09905 [Myxococcales bacterium FL481]|nr:MAG: hypothetical protein B7733_09905 [Myxococcales bacterium FL481]